MSGFNDWRRFRSDWWLAALLLVLAVGYSIVVSLLYFSQLTTLRTSAGADLEAVATLKANQLATLRKERFTDAVILAGRPFFNEHYAEWLVAPTPALTAQIRQSLDVVNAQSYYHNMALFDAAGQERLLLYPDRPLEKCAANAALLQQALTTGDVQLGNIHRCRADAPPQWEVAAPLLVQVDGAVTPVGAILLSINLQETLMPLVNQWPARSDSGEILVAERVGATAVNLNDYLHGAAVLDFQRPLTQTTLPIVQAVLEGSGSRLGVDYRGIAVLSGLATVPGSSWRVVAKQDMAEVDSALTSQLGWYVTGVIGAVTLTGALLVLLVVAQRQRTVRRLYLAERENAFLSAIVASSADAIIGCTVAGEISSWNAGAECMFGYRTAEAVGQPLTMLVASDKRTRMEQVTAQVAQGQVATALETQWLTNDHRALDVSVSSFLVQDANGQVIGIASITRDITEQKRAEAALRELEERFRLTMENSPDIVWIWDAQGNLKYVSATLSTIYGMPTELMLQASAGHLALAAQLDAAERTPARLVALGAPDLDFAANWLQAIQAVEVCVQHPGRQVQQTGKIKMLDGSVRTVQSLYQGYLRSTGKVEVICITHNVTELVQVQEQLQQTLQQLQLATTAADIGIWSWDLLNNRLEWDERLHDIYGISAAERAAGLHYALWRERTHPDDLPEVERILGEVQRTGVGNRANFRIVSPNGVVRYVHSRFVIAQDDQGAPVKMIGVNRDITAQRHFEQELQQARQAAETANQAKSRFLANMSHELRTPLNAIVGMAQLMQDDATISIAQRENLTIIVQSSEHLLTMVNEVLDISKIEAGKMELYASDFDLRATIRTLQAMLQQKADAKQLSLVVDVAPNVPQFVHGDQGKLRQVVVNLLNNAVKFTQEGGVGLKVWGDEAQQVTFCVTDTGPGIAPDEVKKLFSEFEMTASGRQAQESTGLGLAISLKFVQLMGGNLTVDSTLNEGTTFTLRVPMMPATGAEQQQTNAKETVIGLAPGSPPVRVLIVDDIATNRQVLRQTLKPLACEVREAVSGEDALNVWETWQPELIWLDILMEGINGMEVAQQIRHRELERGRRRSCIIAITASAFAEDHADILAAGCDDIVAKPFRRQLIFDKMATHLGLQYTYQTHPSVVQTSLTSAASSRATAVITGQAPASVTAFSPPDDVRVLVVDDNLVGQKLAARLLQKLQVTVDVANNGLEALAALRTQPYALVFMDMQMPVMGGIEATKRIRAEWGAAGPAIIALTGSSDAEDFRAAQIAGIDGWLVKPLRSEDIQLTLERWLALPTAA